MYIINKHTKNNRFAQLAIMGENVFHIDDLANLWGVTNKHNMRVTLTRYIRAGMLKRIYRGLYSIKNIDLIDPHLIGVKAIHAPAYISCETVLFNKGIINQPSQVIDIVSGLSKVFKIGDHNYRSRKLDQKYLFNDAGIELVNGVRTASLERALADTYYYNPMKHIDAHGSSLIDRNKYNEIVETVGYTDQIKKHVRHSK